MDLDFLSSMVDEVSLEGLDGITLTMLWKRLEDRPHFPIALDEDSKAFLWECIAVHKEIEFYELPEPREFVPPYNRYANIDEELGIVIEPVEKLKDSYFPIVPIKDGEIRGSCATYKTRKCITSAVRNDEHLLLSFTQVYEKWGENFVLVSSPKARLLALIGTESNPLLDFTLEAYCLLERIGRSRYLGEVTQGDDGLLSLKTSFCKQLHYYRKKLSNKGLITKQIHYLKNKRGTTSNGCLLHLTRFYVERKTKMECFMKALCDLLKEKPKNRETCTVARQELGIRKNTFKKLFYRPVQKWIQITDLPHSEFYPDAPYKENYTTNGTPRTVKVVQLIKHYDEEEKDDDNEEQENRKDAALPLNIYFDYSKVYHGYPFIQQIYDLIKKAGPDGISSADLGRIMTLPRLDIRNLLRVLMKKNNVISMLVDRGRQKVTQYIAKIYEKENELYNIVKEHEKSNNETHSNEKTSSTKRKDTEEVASPPPKKKVRFDDEIQDEASKKEKDDSSQATDFQNIVSQVLELHNSELFSGRSPKVISILEKPPVPCPSSSATQLTYKKLKRSNTILDYLKEVKFSTVGELQKELRRREKDSEHQLCKRSTARLVHGLANSKKVKIFKVVLKLEDKRTNLEFICDNSVEPTDQCIQVAIEQAKFKYFCVNKDKEKSKEKSQFEASAKSGKENIPEKEKFHTKPGPNQTFSTVNHPKFVRARILHEFLYYLVYDHKGPILKNDEQCVYHDSLTFKRFLPPLPDLTDEKKQGWCFLADIYLRIPLSVFMKVVTIGYPIPNIKEYLEDEEKQHYLIKYLPQDLRNSLLNNRRFLFSTHDVIKNLCYMGLVSMGPQIGKQKDQAFLYVHKNASLKDTTVSSPGYLYIQTNLEYETKQYTFKSLTDVENFWLDLESICFRTQLGRYNSATGKTFSLTEAAYKPELKKCVDSKKFEDIVDSGQIPGDGLGAGGYDSALFMHIKRNWVSSTMKKSLEIKSKSDSQEIPRKYTLQHLLKTKNAPKPENRSRLQRLTKPTLSIKKEKQIQNKSPQRKPAAVPYVSKRQRTIIRTINKRTTRKRLPYYDEVDKEAMKKMKKSRCEWCAQEDSFLLLCKVASLFLDPLYSKNLVVPYTVVRDLLYEHLPEISEAKSSRACQRRVRYMMLNPATVSNVAVYLGEANQDEELVREFNVVKPPKTNVEVWKEMYTRLLNKLLTKFTLPPADRCKNITLPNSLEELNERYKITYSRDILHQEQIHRDPKTISDIKTFVLSSLVLSVMSISKNNSLWKYMLLQLYKSYPSSFLQSVIANLRRNKIIAIKKTHHTVDAQRINSHTPYKFSVIYENALLTKFPIKMFQEAHNLLENFSKINPETGVELKGDVPPGYASAVLSLAALQQLSIHTEIPEHIILFDTSLSQEARSSIVERIIHTLSDKESVELSKILNNESTSFSKNVKSESHIEEVKCSPEDQASDEDSNVGQSVPRTSNASRYALYLLRQEKAQPPIERTQHSQDYIVLNSCRLFCQMRVDSNVVLSLNPPEVLEQTPHDSTKTIQSHILSYDKTHLTEDQTKEILELLTFYIPPSALAINEETCYDSLNILYKDYSQQTLQDAKTIFHSINQAGVKGVVERSIWEEFGELQGDISWRDHLKLLRKAFLVIRTGIMAFTYVSIFHAEIWLLESCLWSEQFERNRCDVCAVDYKNVTSDQDQLCNHEQSATYFDSCEKVYFTPRSWRNPDGTLNKTVFFELLNTVLSHIISTPSVSVKDVCERFVLTMQPVQVLELIEILEKAKCIYRYYYKPAKKSSLFSKPQVAYVTENPGPDCIDHLENFPDAICKISKLFDSL
ncbi:general transcription factor 3C polypeptide 1 [Parasteatoda tepidariorum]|nr:general transcription factor 3C polypeptide 1 [Parasteatoda tepidariorum]XP_042898674.1 general transcription factor 3C polypeptide 1 [Parasteatoda tepidariorum]XP_042898705.1 general transcription factor 3C polypeptide 1 [Parasteatoda tepidariorum]XP_042898760.1 general transcription factor 3C polypeptide 1 [Parasteatoda tepidariorum]XP_042898806.1 general transcription factor 3C polypeptide 1 [Parasteatoda tepidariorum]XP_042898891.1 general transcription factor 3C polypeptide 1 [Parastea